MDNEAEKWMDSPVSSTAQAPQVRNDNIIKLLLIHRTELATGMRNPSNIEQNCFTLEPRISGVSQLSQDYFFAFALSSVILFRDFR